MSELRVVLDLPNNPRSAVRARRVVDELQADTHPETLARARLLVTELVAAGITDTPSDTIKLTMIAEPGSVRGELATRSTRPARPSGWGLFLANRIADRWGVSPAGTVWFEVVDKRKRRFTRENGRPVEKAPSEQHASGRTGRFGS